MIAKPRSQSTVRGVSAPEPPEVATLLAERLERWALVRSKVLSRLDLEGARQAERLAERARFLCTTMLLAGDTQRDQLIGHLHSLLQRATDLMGEPPLPDALATLPPPPTESMKESGERPTERSKLGTNRIFVAKAK